MQFEQAKSFILDKLTKELPGYLSYHTIDHVLDVYGAAETLGRMENLTENELLLLLTAALFHDAGFTIGLKEHEESSCVIAARYLPGYGYSDADIEKISGMIMATKLPQLPKNLSEQIICDADLDYLGRDDFFPISDSLYREFLFTAVVSNENDWNKLQVTFFEKHQYFTASAIKLRQQKKEDNLRSIKSKITGN